MLTFTSIFETEENPFCPAGFLPEQLLYFDIETTGFSADVSSLYLIGCLYYQEAAWRTIQWFADDYHSEKALLTAFFTFSENFKVLLHYNGTGFDIPYLQKKCRQYKLPFSFNHIVSLDIYKELTPYKKLLPLPNLKQKTVENSLGFCREDKYDGGQLISVYVEYIHRKLKKQEGCPSCLSLLLLHNKEDLEGLFLCSRLLLPPQITYKKAVDGNAAERKLPSVFTFQLSFPYCLSWPLSLETAAAKLTLEKNQGALELFPFIGELKYFYPDYKNYYYLPFEDMAIHKSVAEYVEKNYREKAKACNCYTRRNSTFLPVPPGFSLPEGTPLFYQKHKDKIPWFEVEESFLTDAKAILSYLKAMFSKKASIPAP